MLAQRWFLTSLLLIFAFISVLILESIAPSLAPRQFVFALTGFAVFWFTSRLPYRRWEQVGFLGYLIVCFLLVLTLLIAFQTRSTARWILIGDFLAIQPSQLAIPVVGLYAAWFATHYNLTKLRWFLTLAGLILVPAILIFVAPDLGTALVFLIAVGSVFYFAPINWRLWLGSAGVMIAAGLLAWQFVLQPYQKARITSFVQPQEQRGADYHARQALIAVGSGQLWGRGMGHGVQSHLRFLPERQTDFIFASLAEEFGFVGSLVVVSLYVGLIAFLIRLSTVVKSPGAALYCLIAATTIFVQGSINIGMNIGLVPITGVTLPFLSYGGSSFISLSFMLGIVQTIAHQEEPSAELHLT